MFDTGRQTICAPSFWSSEVKRTCENQRLLAARAKTTDCRYGNVSVPMPVDPITCLSAAAVGFRNVFSKIVSHPLKKIVTGVSV